MKKKIGRKKNHHATLAGSDCLQRAAFLMSDGKWYGAKEIGDYAGTINTGSRMSELRSNGFVVEQRYNGKTPDRKINGVLIRGRKKSEYRIVARKKAA